MDLPPVRRRGGINTRAKSLFAPRCASLTTGVPANNSGDDGSTVDEAVLILGMWDEGTQKLLTMRAGDLDDKAKLTVLKTHVKKMQKESEEQKLEWESRVAALTEDLEREQHPDTYTHTTGLIRGIAACR